MKQMAWKWTRFSMLMLVTTSLLFVGCESEDSPDTNDLDSYFDDNPYVSDPRIVGPGDVSISPTAAQATHVGQQIVFDARGGTAPYTWDVATPARGSIAVPGNSQGVYTVLQLEENSVIVYDQNGHAAVGQVVLEDLAPLVITAEDTTLDSNGDKTTLQADGGTPPYTWSVSDGTLGGLDSLTGTSVVYTRGVNSGDNAVTVMDAAGDTASISIHQP